ncbi:MAG: GYD domain-containing protein [Candidatus Zixiibacteriota bacterium]
MKTFVLMTKIARPDANLVEVASRLRDRASDARTWLNEIKEKCPEVKFIAHYALLGMWDFMDIYEAPDEQTAMKVSIITRAHGAHVVESWSAIPNEKIMEITQELRSES